jgi:dTDP-4-amino-4,6-dideoxygalactose transaminase
MAEIMTIAKRNSLAVIEDACQAHGAEYLGQKAGSFGTGCFSFYATKNVTTGEGGMINTNDEGIAERCRMIRNHGSKERYKHEMLGYNYRMTDVEAAIGICQLNKVTKLTNARIENAKRLTEGLTGVKGLILPAINKGVKHVFHQYTVRITADYPLSREELRNRMKNENIGTEVYYPTPIHKQPFYQKTLGYNDALPVAEKAALEALSIPVHPLVTKSDIDRIVKAIKG